MKLLMRLNSDAVGFLPTQAVERAACRGGLIIQRMKSQRIGYLLFGPIRPNKDVYIWQLCIDKDLRGLGHGKKTFSELYKRAKKMNASGIRVRCADNLSSNQFWKTLGFRHVTTQKPKNRRNRAINVYHLPLGTKFNTEDRNQI